MPKATAICRVCGRELVEVEEAKWAHATPDPEDVHAPVPGDRSSDPAWIEECASRDADWWNSHTYVDPFMVDTDPFSDCDTPETRALVEAGLNTDRGVA